VGETTVSRRALALADQLEGTSAELVRLVRRIERERWDRVPAAGVWSAGKDADHVIEAAAYHMWIVRLTIGERVSSRRPDIERKALVTDRAPAEVARDLQARTREASGLIRTLTDEQLALRTKPPRANGERLGETIERVLIAHYVVHLREIEAKLTVRD
jgi:uncharacterized damage-inducible protein DinB